MSLLLVGGCGSKPDAFSTRYAGTLELTEHVLGSRAAGRLTSVNVKEGDVLRAGQVLATMDRYEQNLKDYERLKELFNTGGANAQELEHAKLAVEDQQIISPVDGVVLLKTAETGEILPAGAGVVVVGNKADQWVKIFMPEGVIGQVKLGQPAKIYVDGIAKPYEGRISFIATKAEFTPRNVQTPEERVTQVFAVKVKLDSSDEHLHPGVGSDVQFIR